MTTPLHRNTYEQGFADGKAESAETIRLLREAFTTAMTRYLAMSDEVDRLRLSPMVLAYTTPSPFLPPIQVNEEAAAR